MGFLAAQDGDGGGGAHDPEVCGGGNARNARPGHLARGQVGSGHLALLQQIHTASQPGFAQVVSQK